MFKYIFLPIFVLALNYNSILNTKIDNKRVYQLKFNDFNIQKCKTDIDLNISNRVNLAKYEYYSNDLGLYLDISGNVNDKTSKNSLIAGIRWKLLNNGYRQNQNKAELIKLQTKLNNLQNIQINNSFIYYNDYNFIIYFYNQKKIKLLDNYLSFLDKKLTLFKHRYYQKQTTLDKVLSVKQEIADTINLQNTYKIFNKKVVCKKDIQGYMPDFDLKYNLILKDIEDNNITIKKELSNQIIDKQYDKFNNWKFDLYVNKNFTKHQGENFGFSMSIPLTKKSKEIKKLEKLKTLSSFEEGKLRKYLYLQKNYYVFRYKLSDLINMRYKLAYVKAQYKRAKFRYQFHIGNSNFDRMVSNIDSMFAIKLQMLDIKQQLLLKAYSLLYNLGLKFSNKYIKKIDIDTSLHLRDGNRTLYMWANGFKKYNNQLLLALLKLKNIKTVLISISKYQNFKKLSKFIQLAKKNNIKIIYLLQYHHKMKKLDYNIYEVNVYIDKVDKNLGYFLEKLHNKYPKYKIDLTINNNIILPPYINKVYAKNGDVFVINAKQYKNELQLELAIDKILKKNKNIAIYDLKTYMKVIK